MEPYRSINRYAISLLFCLLPGLLSAADLTREGRIAEQIFDAILEGQPIWLKAEGRRFLAIHTLSPAKQVQGGVILLHSMGANPDWDQVIHPLRTALPKHGWETLSIQLPVAAPGATQAEWLRLIPEAFPRIRSAAKFFREQNNHNLVLIGHSLGARMGLEFLADGAPPEAIRAFVAIGLPTPQEQEENPVYETLRKLKLPMLDLYGSRDLASVTDTARLRRIVAKRAELQAYRQDRIEGADHFFSNLEQTLINRTRAWIRRHAAGEERQLK
ncbi:alpha/beta fold hydrolase [endosymbiont of Ridgeia piscesae]|jgi:pimeloyl-ACP methyl ester carboxylesterase|uniref:Alpha/beta hydrolase family n=1 Tax=endosymbiont of Ridgeia piscesae TaxID=54398 RepID=A0A0T5Z736_9GAMM|nr:alpha/beta fold hydrolase [endosymbiont of Ridgeia piscesae]KRT58406.1 Protein of unknown function (DUF3530) [endosymbiont of Ridgeia piscesae]